MAAKPSIIALDGPVAVGKTTVGRALARRMGYRFYDTGAMYRALTWLALQKGVDPRDETALTQLAQHSRIQLLPGTDGDEGGLLVDGRDITSELRESEVEASVSPVSEVAGVRRCLVAQQRELAQGGGVVMAGRDIGTVVLPQADLKVFLIASPEERAHRRQQELLAQGKEAPYEKVLENLRRRDRIDSQRAHSPLKPAQGAEVIDTDSLTLEQVLERVMKLVQEALCR
ncbi:MAG: (d)CMP kinase [Chloroflexi bacterium]|nr:(d)CMP kinase [Chloroflexota bacterium]